MDSNGEHELDAAARAVATEAMEQWDDKTTLTMIYDSSPTFSGVGETDVVWRETYLEPGTFGTTFCMDKVDNQTHGCDSHYIDINPYGGWITQTARHEAGHAFGLVHGNKAFPIRDKCAAVMGIMRSARSCSDSSALGDAPKNNVNHVY